MNNALPRIALLFLLLPLCSNAQDQAGSGSGGSSVTDKIINFPTKLFGKIQSKTASLDQQLTRQTENYLQKMARREARLQKKLYKVDSAAAKRLFANSAQQYAALRQKIANDTGGHHPIPLSGEYQPYTDSLQGSLSFLQQNPQLLSGGGPGAATPGQSPLSGQSSLPAQSALQAGVTGISPQSLAPGISPQSLAAGASPQSLVAGASSQSLALQSSITQLQQLQAKMLDADAAKAFIQQRKQEIGNYISQHANLQTLLGSQYQGFNQEAYYYSQQVRAYKEMLNHPDQLEQKALSLLDKLPAFQQFMKNNSQLAGLFNLPANYGDPAALAGLQTRDQVNQAIQTQLAAGGAGATAALQSNLQTAEQGLDSYKDKLSQLGSGSGDIDMPNFTPNNQKTKTFLKRLQLGTDLQTTRSNYYFPTMTDLGLSLGYKLSDKAIAGVGASYKIGWGTGFNHIALSSQGAGLRSFLDIKIKGSFSATGGLEYNYTTPINSLQQLKVVTNWTQSGLIGISKTVAVKNRFFKQTSLQLLWDFLSYQQIPRTQPIIFRVGYVWH